MINRFNAWLNGIALTSLCDELKILDIQYNAPRLQNNAVRMAKGDGARIIGQYTGNTTVVILFELRLYNTRQRQEVCQEIAAWAKNGGLLQISDRPSQRLNCICEIPPVITSALNWTETLSITFSAYALPFWEECYPVSITLNGPNSTGSLFVPGNAGNAHVFATVTAKSLLTDVVMIVDDTEFQLLNFSLPAGEKIEVYYDDNMLLHIEASNQSIRDKRTSVSSDKLLAKSGKINTFVFRSNNAATCEYRVRGVWV